MLRSLALVAFTFCLTSASSAQSEYELHTRGWVEHARLLPSGILMDAKLDSGARTTSIHAEILPPERAKEATSGMVMADLMQEAETSSPIASTEMSSKDAPDDPPASEVTPMAEDSMDHILPEMVTFRVSNNTGKNVILTEPVTRWVAIRRRGGGSIIRPVVTMDLCVGGQRVRGEVNLADRTGFNYPLLIGRNMLSDAAISVDSSQIYTASSACSETD